MDGIICGSEGFAVEGVEIDTTVEVPDRQARAAALAGSKYRIIIAVGIVSIGDSHLSFDFVDGMLKHGALDGRNVAMESERHG